MSFLRFERVVVKQDPATDSLDFHVIVASGSHGNELMQPIVPPTITHIPHGLVGTGPAFRMHPDSAQVLLDALWDAGIRPSKPIAIKVERDPAGEALAAKNAHIEDLRRIVYHQLQMPPPVPHEMAMTIAPDAEKGSW